MLAEQLFCDHHALDLVGAFVDLGGLARPSVCCRIVVHSVTELRRQSGVCWNMLACVIQY